MKEKLKKVLFSSILYAIDKKEIEEDVKILINEDLLSLLYKLSKSHDVAHLVAYALENMGVLDKDKDVAKKFSKEQTMAIFRCEQLIFEVDNVCKTFEKARIPFIPLKGSVIRDIYPEPWMRTSCDIDVLVREEDLDLAIETLKRELNFLTDGVRSSHDVALYSETGVHLELHFDLTEGEGKGVLSSVWERTSSKDGYEFWKVLDEDVFYLYHIKHMIKHFEAGGCGVKPLIDLYLMQSRLNIRENAKELLKNEGVEKFENAIYNLCTVWFCGAEKDDLSTDLEAYIFKGGVYGSVENRVLTQQIQKGGKLKYLLSRIFMPYKALAIKYPSLKKCPILFPFYQVRRWFNLLFEKGRGKQSLKELGSTTSVDKNQAKTQTELLRKLGLGEKD